MTNEQAQTELDELRAEHPINGALQDLASFMIHTTEKAGIITPTNAVHLAKAAEQAVEALLNECNRLATENEILRQRNNELLFLFAGPKEGGNT